MSNLYNNLGHILLAIVIIVCVTVMAIHNTITGQDAMILIAGLGGVSVGGSVASSLAGAVVSSSVGSPSSSPNSTSGGTTATTVATDTTPITNTPSPNVGA